MSAASQLNYVKSPAARAEDSASAIEDTVREIIAQVRARGDAASARILLKFDGKDTPALEVSMEVRLQAVADLDAQTREDTEFAIERVRAFAQAQLATVLPWKSRRCQGLHLGHRVIPVQRIGAYVPGGRYPILSAPVMTIVPAKVAGCEEVIACLPPGAHPAMIAGCHLSGADRIFLVGGAQAIAAMACGTGSPFRPWTRSSAPATPTSTKPSARCSAKSASTNWPAPARSSWWPTKPATPI